MAAKFYGRAFVILFIELILVMLSECCVKKVDPEPKAEEMIARSDYVVYGTVLEKIKDPRTPNLASAYGIRFEVTCIYKGNASTDPLKNKVITVAGGGDIDPTCYSLDVDVSERYLLYLNQEGSHIVPSYGAPKDISKRDPFEVVVVCNMFPYAPGGENLGTEHEECPATEEGTCVRYTFPTEPPKPTTTIKVEKPVPLPSTPAPKDKQTPADKVQVQGGDKEGQKNDNNSATIILTSMFSLVICLSSAILMS